jgi:hypothetical protein
VHHFKAPVWAQSPTLRPDRCSPLYDPAIYAPTVVARQPSVSSSTTSSAFGFSFSAIVIA